MSKTVAEQTVNQMMLVYHELGPVQEAYTDLLAALETFDKKTGNWPPVHLGLPHYKHAIEEIKTHRAEVLEAAHVLRRTLVDKRQA